MSPTPSMVERLRSTIADLREDAQRLHAHGHGTQAASLERACDLMAAVARPMLTTLSDGEAMMRTGWKMERLRSHFATWQRTGLAYLDERGKRRYAECVLPPRADHAADRLAGERGTGLRGAP